MARVTPSVPASPKAGHKPHFDAASSWRNLVRKPYAAYCLAIVASLSVAACDASAESDGSSTSQAQLDKAKSTASTAQGPALFDATEGGPARPSGDFHFISLECAAAAGGCARLAEANKEAGEALGWTVDIIDGKGDVNVYNTAIAQAVAQHVDGIFLDAIDARAVGDSLAKARAAGIPVVSQAAGNPTGDGEGDVFAEVNSPNVDNGTSLAAWVINDSQGKAKVWMFHAPEFGGASDRYTGSREAFEKDCDGCQILGDTKYQSSTAATDLASTASSILAAHPDIDYMWTDIDGFGLLVAQAIRQSGKADSVRAVSFDANAENLKLIADDDIQVATVGLGLEQAGWSAMDQMIRAVSSQPPGPQGIPTRLFDGTNLPASETYEGDADFRDFYLTQWGIN